MDPFIGRFLHIFEDVLSPVQQIADTLPERFDPGVTPPPMLDLLSTWVGGHRPDNMPETRWRKLVRNLVSLHRWRGTKRGLRLALELATGRSPLIAEYGAGLVVSDDAALGSNTALDDRRPLQIAIVFDCPAGSIDRALIDDIIRDYKPAHISHSLVFSTSQEDGSDGRIA